MDKFLFFRAFLIVTLLSVITVSVDATSITNGLPLSALPMDGRENAYRNESAHPEGEIIIAFDASDEMGVLLITRTAMSEEKHLRYLDKDGKAIAVFSFESPGDTGVAWDGSDICVFFTRGRVIEIIDCSGSLKARYAVTSTQYEADKAWSALSHRKERETDAGTYRLQARGLSLLKGENDFTTLVFVDRNSGQERTLYDAGTSASVRSWLLFTLELGFVILVITMIVRRAKKYGNVNQGALL